MTEPEIPLTRYLPLTDLVDAVSELFSAAGLSTAAAHDVATSLVDSDARGIASHGVMLTPMYLARLRAGSVSTATRARVVRDEQAVAVLDAERMLGQLSARQGMDLAVTKAAGFGVGVVTVHDAFHFGAAGAYARRAADAGFIGIAMANTRPLMPAPGGAEPVVGNNPLAFAAPTAGAPVVVDLALSEVALGRIRNAEAEGTAIPPTWATDHEGRPTTDPAAAIKGMLLPTGGRKGFGLALMVELLTGALSGGAITTDVAGLYHDVTAPNGSSHTFIALDPSRFPGATEFRRGSTLLADRVRSSTRAPGSAPVRLPGDGSSEAARRSAEIGVPVSPATLRALAAAAEEFGTASTVFQEGDSHVR
ncbi:Ldh family oxidoreductase [Jiangella endophytica]|uniref:Ldh family oxidoreductase n=1 Tax=Jiangella endophytica TaxID=1623398 RepID=UPI000E3554D5|nr:Ldh family oxidoreductase [Jiangella endophytica]